MRHSFSYFLFVLLLSVICLCSGCKTVEQTVDDNSLIQRSDSTKTERIDSTTSSKVDSLNVAEKSQEAESAKNTKRKVNENTTLEFGPNGTFNVHTGEATGVVGAEISKQMVELENELKKSKEREQSLEQVVSQQRDSIATLNQQNNIIHNQKNDIQSEYHETNQSHWYWWMIFGTFIGMFLSFALRHIPMLKALFFWI